MWCSDQESTCQCKIRKRHRFHPWVGKIPWTRKWQPNTVFLLEKSHGKKILVGYSPRNSLVTQMVKNPPAMQETQVGLLGLEYPLEDCMATLQYSCLENPWTEEPGRLQSMGLQRIGYDWATNTHTYYLKELREGTWLRERELLSETTFIGMTYLYGKENI